MEQLVLDIAEVLRIVDCSGIPYKHFAPGVGPYGEPELTKLLVQHLYATQPDRYEGIKKKRTPDVLVPGRWAIEIKIIRPFGDNGDEAEHWSQNLLHPYPGNVSAISDAFKLRNLSGNERRAIIAIGYEHNPPKIDLSILMAAFELLCRKLLNLPLGPRTSHSIDCIHTVHQRATVFGWELRKD